MPIRPIEVSTFSKIPSFVPFGVEYFTQDTADLYVGTGASSGPAVVAVNGGGGGTGTVTSVKFAGDGVVLSATPSAAVTTAGSIAATLANANANTVLGNATASTAAPSYGQVVNGQIANGTIDLTSKVTGVLPAANGGAMFASSTGSGYFIGPGYMFPPAGVAGNVVVNSANQVRCYFFNLPIAITVRSVSVRVTTLSTGSSINAGIYSADKNTKLIDSGAFSGSTAGNLTNTISPVTLTPGAYWFTVGATDSTVQTEGYGMSSVFNSGIPGLLAPNGSGLGYGGLATNTLSGGSLPSSLGTITGNNGTSVNAIPNIVFKA